MSENFLGSLGDTPLVKLKVPELDINLYSKLEFLNPTGSIKDRSANYMITNLLESNEINSETNVIESSSGNFGIALSAICSSKKIKFTCVIDPLISATNEYLIKQFGGNVVKVSNKDKNGGYLLTRIEKVKSLISETNTYWTNQYANPLNARAYFETLGKEIVKDIDLDYIFLGVSSGGTITGLSQCVKKFQPKAKVIAVDVEGSVIFGGSPKKRFIPGIGAGMRGRILDDALIDEVVIVSEQSTVENCRELLSRHKLLAGGSSGSTYSAIKSYFSAKSPNFSPNVLFISCDRGERYFNTIYNDRWCAKNLGMKL